MRIGPVGIWELLIILVLVLLVFGPRRLPEMAKGMGQAIREFRKGLREVRADIDADTEPARTEALSAAQESPQRTAGGRSVRDRARRAAARRRDRRVPLV